MTVTDTTLLGAGIACIIAAIVGGGLKAFGIEIPVLSSVYRQVALGALGIVLIWLGVPPGQQFWPPGPPKPPLGPVGGCLERYVQGVPGDRVKRVESGTKDAQVIGPHQEKDLPMAVIFTDDGKPIGAVRYRFFGDNKIFKIESVVDAQCRTAEDYANATRGGDKHVLQNWDELEVRFGGVAYNASFEYAEGRVDMDFIRVDPAR